MSLCFCLVKQNIKKILEKWQKILEKSGNFVSPEKWEPCYCFHPGTKTSICIKYLDENNNN